MSASTPCYTVHPARFLCCCAAISQRNILENPDGLQCQGNELREMMLEFFEEHIQDQFPEDDYTFDVYITTAGKVCILFASHKPSCR